MEPDYSSYTQQELLEAFNSIDRDAYPERFEQIKKHLKMEHVENDALPKHIDDIIPRTIEGRFQNKLLLAGIVLGLFFLMGVWGTYEYFIAGRWTEFRQLAFPVLIFLSPWAMWLAKRRWIKHQNDWLKLDEKRIGYSEVGTIHNINWNDVKAIFFVVKHRNTKYIFESVDGVEFSLTLSHFGLDTNQVESFIRLKAQEYGFKFEKIGFMGISWDKSQ